MTGIDLTKDLAVFEVSGEDSAKYLQGQLTNNINELEHTKWQLTAHLNNKGRVLASFIITRLKEQSYLLITTRSIADSILSRLKMFILRSKVKIELTPKLIFLKEEQIKASLCLPLGKAKILLIADKTDDNNSGSSSNNSSEINPNNKLKNDTNGDNKVDNNEFKNNKLELSSNLYVANKLLVDLAIPMVYKATEAKLTLHELSYDLIGGVSFNKGCYVGQEIVARTHYLGKAKRRVYRFISEELPQIGQIVVSPLFNNQEIGVIIDFYLADKEHKYYGLASIHKDCVEASYLDVLNQHKIYLSLIS